MDNEIGITAFQYANGNHGLMAQIGKREFNLTLNIMDSNEFNDGILLKMWGDAEQICRELGNAMVEQGVWTKQKATVVGLNYGQYYTINKNSKYTTHGIN